MAEDADSRRLTIGERKMVEKVFGIDYANLPYHIFIHPHIYPSDPYSDRIRTEGSEIYFPVQSSNYKTDFSFIVDSYDWSLAGVFIHEVAHALENILDLPDAPSNSDGVQNGLDQGNYNYDILFTDASVSFSDLGSEARASFMQDYFYLISGRVVDLAKQMRVPNPDTSPGAPPTIFVSAGSVDLYTLQEYKDRLPEVFKLDPPSLLSQAVSWVSSLWGRTQTDPIVLDLDGGGVHLTHIDSSNAQFDLHNTGFAVDTGWIGSGDGFLVRDLNNNGVIDNIAELFGDANTSGFEALEAIDSNHDGKITSVDSAWAGLKVWVDADGDGQTDAGELKTLADVGVTELDLNSQAVDVEVNGNIIGEVATFKFANGVTGQVAEAGFGSRHIVEF